MARYDIRPEMFTTPRGNPCVVYIREGTNDWNTANACLGRNDEYNTAGYDFTGTSGLFVDIGGYLGTVALAVLLDHPGTRAIIVEPIPENLDLIRRILSINGVLDRASLIAGAVGSGQTTIHYGYDPSPDLSDQANENNLHHAYVGNGVGSGGAPHKSVTYQGLSYREVIGDEAPAMVKIDCEGGEWPVLHEMTDVPLIVGEYHPITLPDGSVGSRALAESILGATHDITYGGPIGSPEAWGFRAVRRA